MNEFKYCKSAGRNVPWFKAREWKYSFNSLTHFLDNFKDKILKFWLNWDEKYAGCIPYLTTQK